MAYVAAFSVALIAAPAAHAAQLLRGGAGRQTPTTPPPLPPPVEAKQSLRHEYDGVYRIRQKGTQNYLDAYEGAFFLKHPQPRPGFEVVTRPTQKMNTSDGYDHTQFWLLEEDLPNTYSFMQYTTGRFLEGSATRSVDWQTDRICQIKEISTNAAVQRWFIQRNENVTSQVEVRLFHATTEMYLDAFLDGAHDWQAMVRPLDPTSDTQLWVLEKIYSAKPPLHDGLYAIEQKSTNRKLDAYRPGAKDTFCITRPIEFSETQHWIIRHAKGEVYSIQQQASGMLLGAEDHVIDGHLNYTVVSRAWSNSHAQKWLFLRQSYDEFVLLHIPSGRVLDAYEFNVSATGLERDFRAYTAEQSVEALDGKMLNFVWRIRKLANLPSIDGIYRVRQKSTGRYLEASPGQAPVQAVTAPEREGNDQLWEIAPLEGDVLVLKQAYRPVTSQLVLSAVGDIGAPYNFTAFAYTAFAVGSVQSHMQMWYPVLKQANEFQFRNDQTLRFLDAPDPPTTGKEGPAACSRKFSGTDSQVWQLIRMGDRCPERLWACPPMFQCGVQSDYCGGNITCGPTKDGLCTASNPITGTRHACDDDHLCKCVPKPKCEGECGREPDGCGGFLTCGLYGGCKTNFTNNLTGDVGKCTPLSNSTNMTYMSFNLSLEYPSASPSPAAAGFASPPPGINKCECVPQGCDFVYFAPAPAVAAATLPKPKGKFGPDCRMQKDGCGNVIECGSCSVLAPPPLPPPAQAPANAQTNKTPSPAPSPAPAPAPAPGPCVPNITTCTDKRAECGFMDNGCGGNVPCGNWSGACPSPPNANFTCSADRKCVCEPKKCENRCGTVPDNCGNTIPCSCELADQICDAASNMCVAIPGPAPAPSPAPAPAPNVTNVTNASMPPAPAPPPAGPPQVDCLALERVHRERAIKTYDYLYYFFFYYHFLTFRAAKVSATVAAARASELAKPSAMEQLRRMVASEDPGELAKCRAPVLAPSPAPGNMSVEGPAPAPAAAPKEPPDPKIVALGKMLWNNLMVKNGYSHLQSYMETGADLSKVHAASERFARRRVDSAAAAARRADGEIDMEGAAAAAAAALAAFTGGRHGGAEEAARHFLRRRLAA